MDKEETPNCESCGELMEELEEGEYICPKGCGIPHAKFNNKE